MFSCEHENILHLLMTDTLYFIFIFRYSLFLSFSFIALKFMSGFYADQIVGYMNCRPHWIGKQGVCLFFQSIEH